MANLNPIFADDEGLVIPQLRLPGQKPIQLASPPTYQVAHLNYDSSSTEANISAPLQQMPESYFKDDDFNANIDRMNKQLDQREFQLPPSASGILQNITNGPDAPQQHHTRTTVVKYTTGK